MKYCLCCTNKLLRHLEGSKTYWFCLQCRQRMPHQERSPDNSKTYQQDF